MSKLILGYMDNTCPPLGELDLKLEWGCLPKDADSIDRLEKEPCNCEKFEFDRSGKEGLNIKTQPKDEPKNEPKSSSHL